MIGSWKRRKERKSEEMEEITFDFELLGSVTLSPLGVCLGEVVVVVAAAASFLLCEDGRPVVTWLFHKVKAEPSMTPALRQLHDRSLFCTIFDSSFLLPRFGFSKEKETFDIGSLARPKWERFPPLSSHFSFGGASPPSDTWVGRKLEALIRGLFFLFYYQPAVRVNVQLLRYGASSDYTVRRVKSGMECSIVLYCFVEWYCGKEETYGLSRPPFVISRRK